MAIKPSQFLDVSSSANITNVGQSWGASWGDFNGDLYPDLYLSRHQESPGSLYLNQGDGTFTDIGFQVLEALPRDNHGATWGDIDNDGDPDLIQVTGGGSGRGVANNSQIFSQLYINDAGTLTDQSETLGVTYPLGRGRTSLFTDVNVDGLLDLVFTGLAQDNGQGPTTIFQQTEQGLFEDVRLLTGLEVQDSSLAFLADLSGNDNLELGFSVPVDFPGLIINEVTPSSFQNITKSLLDVDIVPRYLDAAVADFNGDLKTDLFLTRRKRSQFSEVATDKLGRIVSRLTLFQREQGIQFKGDGEITLDFFLRPVLPAEQVFLGSNAIRAEEFGLISTALPTGYQGEWQFTLSPADSRLFGIPSEAERAQQEGVYIGYDPASKQWQLFIAGESEQITLIATPKEGTSFSEIEPIGFSNRPPTPTDQLLIQTDQGLVDQSETANINTVPYAGNNAVAGDFDNDMDVDIYVVTKGLATNTPNVLYDNQGDGTFVPVLDAGGAQGSSLGLGDVAVSADYNLDGFLDLFVTNGGWPPPFAINGSDQLFLNRGNDNHWLTIDLEGVVSNRDGVGAKVFVTAGGVTQVREQSGGVHLYSQNHQRLHFGLANNHKIDEIRVRWPNGQEQRIENIPADQLIRIVEEPGGVFRPGKPKANLASGPYVTLWKDTFEGPYRLRTLGDSETPVTFSVDFISDQSLESVTPVSLEPGDRLTESDFGFSFTSRIKGFQDGVDFQLAPGATGLLSIQQDGVANPRQLYVGSTGNRLAPAGWIFDPDQLPKRSNFTPGQDLGLLIGQGNQNNTFTFRWSGDGNEHQADLNVLASNDSTSFSPVNLETPDTLTALQNGVQIRSQIDTSFDGLNVRTPEPVKLGFSYQQDGLNQVHLVDNYDKLLGFQNAYQIPLANPYGHPIYNAAQEAGIFLWKNEATNTWRLRATAGGELRRYQGSIISSQPLEAIQLIGIEAGDRIEMRDPTQLEFDLNVANRWQDGIDFRIPVGATASLNLQDNGSDASSWVNVGVQKWSVSALPLDLSGWDA